MHFISNEVTHHLDDVFVLRQMMETTSALISNPEIHLDPYASPLCVPVLTCLMGRKLGAEGGVDALKEQYQLREFSASLIGQIGRKFAKSNKMLRPKVTRSCLKHLLDINMPPAVWYGAILGLAAAGGPESVKVLLIPNLKEFDANMLQKLKDSANENSRIELEAILGAIIKVTQTAVPGSDMVMTNGVNGAAVNEREAQELKDFVGETVVVPVPKDTSITLHVAGLHYNRTSNVRLD